MLPLSSAVVTARAILILIVMSLGLVHAQDARSQPILAGEGTLTTRDVSEITALASSEAPVWLIRVGEQCPRGLCIAVAFLRPEVETATLRRGKLVFLNSESSGDDPKRIRWHVLLRESWAQVALPGKPFGKGLKTSSDITGFFYVQEQIPDQQVVRVVRFIRGLSLFERIAHGLKDLPISEVRAGPGGATVVVHEQIIDGGLLTRQKVELTPKAGGWEIKSVSTATGILN